MFDENKLRARLEQIAQDRAHLSPKSASDFAFHMTDWLDDLKALLLLYQEPDKLSLSQASEVLLAFLSHAPNHLAAASKLYAELPVTDVFNVGATSDRRVAG